MWKNSEDELLKAGVMKYGTQNWARVASLLPRKTAAQCKARWHNWLDPSIKKTEWTREEDERLLYLAKVRATQWRTISALVGRTPAQCLERYEKLIDEATAKLAGDSTKLDPKDDPRRLRAGERDPMPEARPARPDPVDMEEEELEMLAEARARLANTRGKKAKRKAREKQLQGAKRAVALQKMRELKAAGLEVPKKRGRAGIDFAKEVPYEHRAPAGFYDTSSEDGAAAALRAEVHDFEGKKLHEALGQKREAEEARDRRESARKQRDEEALNLPKALADASRKQDAAHVKKRTKLSLPKPQLSEEDVEALARLGAGAGAEGSGFGVGGGSSSASAVASSIAMPPPSMAGRRRDTRDSVMEEARNQAALRDRQTPLAGGVNVELEAGISSLTPGSVMAAPRNPMLNPLAARLAAAGATTPAALEARALAGGSLAPATPLGTAGHDDAASDIGDSASVTAARRGAGSVSGRSARSGWTAVSRGGRPVRDRLGLNRSQDAMAGGSVLGVGGGSEQGGGALRTEEGGSLRDSSSVAGQSVATSAWGDAELAEVEALSVLASGVREISMTRAERRALRDARRRLAAELQALPEPEYDLDVLLEDEDRGGTSAPPPFAAVLGASSSSSSQSVSAAEAAEAAALAAEMVASRLRGVAGEDEAVAEDAEEADRRVAAAREAAARAEFARRSAALRHPDRLPRPPAPAAERVSAARLRAASAAAGPVSAPSGEPAAWAVAAAAALVDAEVLALARADAFRHPLRDAGGRPELPSGEPTPLDDFDDGDLAVARDAVAAELRAQGLPAEPVLPIGRGVTDPSVAPALEEAQAAVEAFNPRLHALWVPSTGEWAIASPSADAAAAVTARFPSVNAADVTESLKQHHAALEAAVARDEKRLAKRASELNGLLQSKAAAAAAASEEVVQAHAELCSSAQTLAAYSRLLKAEERAAVLRLADEQELLDRAMATERELQRRFSDLSAIAKAVA